MAYKPKEQKMMCKRNQFTAFPGKAFPGLKATQCRMSLRERRGVLLLVVLSLLMLFSLVAVTFVLVSSRHYETTRYAVKNEQTGDDPRDLLDNVFAQCVRGTDDPHSVIGPHSLLEDLYGNDGVRGSITSAVQGTGGLIDITINGIPTAITQYQDSAGVTQPIVTAAQIQQPGQYNGAVLTMIDGPLAGRSTRIIGWSGGATIVTRVMPFDGTILPGANRFIINGRPFNGTGFGFDPSAASNAATLVGASQAWSGGTALVPYVSLPNPVYFGGQAEASGGGGNVPDATVDTNYRTFGGIGGADEEYDAADSQNMLLAHIPLNPMAGGFPNLIPSLHRPDTIRYARSLGAGGTAGVERQVLLRPHPADHPHFPRLQADANYNVTAAGQSYDVDNDGDGVTDSIWVDAGLPVRTGPDGRMYKPMVAILCVDLDGRMNVNAHGNIAHVDRYLLDPADPAMTAAGVLATQFNFTPSPFRQISRGQGYGPAEISLFPLFNPLGTPTAPPNVQDFYARLLAARYSEPNTNFYDIVADQSLTAVYSSAPGFTVGAGQKLGAFPGVSLFADRMAHLKFAQYPFYTTYPILSSFASPPDLHGKGYVAVDGRGMPVHLYQTQFTDRLDSPYELNLFKNRSTAPPQRVMPTLTAPDETTPNPIDSPFSTAELERILRMYDLGSSELPDRLRYLLDGTGGPPLPLLRNMITTDSNDLPTPTVLPTRDMRAQAGATPIVSPSLGDLLLVRMNGVYTGAWTPAQRIQNMLPPDLVSGLKFDLNRAFGNGRDDSTSGTPGYGIVDEPYEVETAMWNALTMNAPLVYSNTSIWPNLTNGIDMDGDLDVDNDDNRYARQLYARYLYVLMMMLKDRTAQFDSDGDGVSSDVETAYAIAQWAVNVVDFRDQDSVMTRFVFNLNPFVDGWTADVDPTVPLDPTWGEVWGCERPELLMTETLAFHDRRTEDLPLDDTVNNPMNAMDPDTDFDQRLPPRGSLFVELYNPWTTQTSSSVVPQGGEPAVVEAPGEFYSVDAAANTVSGIDLRATAGGSPVWRMLIVGAAPTDVEVIGTLTMPKDPDHFDPARKLPAGSIERSIYFTTPPGSIGDGKQYFANTTQVIPPLLPGRYAVIGSAGVSDGAGNYITTIGRQNLSLPTGTADRGQDGGTNASIGATRRIVLTPSNDVVTPLSVVFSNYATIPDPPATAYLRPLSVVIDQAVDAGVPVNRSVSISEPVTGYTGVAPATAPNEPLMTTIQDEPLDNNVATNPVAPVNQQVFRYVHLQRLADPTRAFDQYTNPYRTIDTAPIALSVFNGVAQEPGVTHTGLATWQRGGTDGGGGGAASMLWKFFPNIGGTVSPASAGAPVHHFAFELSHSLGYLNEGFGDVQGTNTYSVTPPYGSYLGSPKDKPFPWLTWNNRPYAGAMELLLVPRSRSSRLMFDYQPPVNMPYTVPAPPPGHLLPFFGAPSVGGLPRMEFHRVLDYVGVRSPFVGTESELDPVQQSSASLPAFDTLYNERNMMSYFHTPFNQVANYREPGRINVNTIVNDTDPSNSSIWNGVKNQDANDTGPLWTAVAASRQGYTAGNTPSVFMNPVRSAAGESLGLPGDPNAANRDEIDVTLLRPTDPDSDIAADVPLLGYQSAKAFNSTNLHHYFGSQTLRRLENSLTTRSNVYAIWITVGYFEARSAASAGPSTQYPDGYWLFGEIGSDTGEIKRHRAFYIYDRSIPVAFERGKDHNMADGILLKRFIE